MKGVSAIRAFIIASCLFVSHMVAAQDGRIEYGRVEELKDVKTFFIDAGEDLDLRNIIRDILVRELGVTIADRPEDSEHVIVFRWSDSGPVWRAQAIVAKRVGPDRLRVLSNHRSSETELNDLADEYAKWLVKQMKRFKS